VAFRSLVVIAKYENPGVVAVKVYAFPSWPTNAVGSSDHPLPSFLIITMFCGVRSCWDNQDPETVNEMVPDVIADGLTPTRAIATTPSVILLSPGGVVNRVASDTVRSVEPRV
jgi:hypothetical protein